jgi:hypothetical protein
LVDAGDKVAGHYGVTGFPTNLVIDRRGIVQLAESGYDPGSLEQAVKRLLGGG